MLYLLHMRAGFVAHPVALPLAQRAQQMAANLLSLYAISADTSHLGHGAWSRSWLEHNTTRHLLLLLLCDEFIVRRLSLTMLTHMYVCMYVCTWHTDGSGSGTVAPVPTHTCSPAPAPLSAVTVCCQGCAGIRIRVRMCGCQLGYALRRVACLGVDNDALVAHQTSWFCLISLPFQHSSPMDCSQCGCRTHFVHIPFFVFNLNFCSARCSFGTLGLFSSLISHFSRHTT